VDVLPIVDVSDTTMAASGTTKKITSNQILGAGGTATLASATITGNLTVDANTLFVDAANDRVGIGTASPAAGAKLGVFGATSVSTSDYIASSTWAARFIGSSNGASSGISFLTNSSSGFPTPASIHATPIADYRSALVLTYSADSSGAGYFAVNRSSPIGANTLEHYKIDNAGVATWSNVGGVAGTAMTLNATGLGVGVASPTAKLDVNGTVIIRDTFSLLMGFGNQQRILAGGGSDNTYLTFSQWTGAAYTERARIDASGNLLVGTTSALIASSRRLSVVGTVAAALQSTGAATVEAVNVWHTATTGDNIFIDFDTEASVTSRGSISYNRSGGLVAYNTTSDYRAKDIIGPVSNSGSVIDSLKVYIGKMKGASVERPMLVAHEAQTVAPYAVTGEKDAVDVDGNPRYQQMDVSSFVPLLIAEIQSLRARVQTLEAR
jgi:hypothetical protein